MPDSDADASLHTLPDEKSRLQPLFCKWLLRLVLGNRREPEADACGGMGLRWVKTH